MHCPKALCKEIWYPPRSAVLFPHATVEICLHWVMRSTCTLFLSGRPEGMEQGGTDRAAGRTGCASPGPSPLCVGCSFARV